MVFHWSPSDRKSPQVTRTFLSSLVDLNNAVVWMVSAHPLISQSSSLFTNSLVTVPSAPNTIGVTVTFIFYRFFSFLPKIIYFILTLLSAGTAKSIIRQVLFFCYVSLGLVVCLRLGDPFVSRNPWEFFVSHSPGWILDYAYTICLYYYYYHYLFIRVFRISLSWWSFTIAWVTASLLKSPGLFSVFWPFSIRL